MNKPISNFNWFRIIMLCAVSFGLGAGYCGEAQAKKEKPASKKSASKKTEVKPTQSGSFLIKFKAHTSEANIREVTKYYGAYKVLPLSRSESSSRQNPKQWLKLYFDSVDSVKDIARRIFHDIRVDEVDDVVTKIKR